MAFKQYFQDMIAQDKAMLKKVIKGGFKQSILLRTKADDEREQKERVRTF